MRRYASQYGRWIERVAEGWEAIGQPEYAAEERRHVELWAAFCAALETESETPDAGVRALLDAAEIHFSDRAAAIGALYAFETQQAGTAQTKLRGIRRHYALDDSAGAYFEAHLDGGSETALLLSEMMKLAPAEQGRAVAACESTARALFDALGDFTDA